MQALQFEGKRIQWKNLTPQSIAKASKKNKETLMSMSSALLFVFDVTSSLSFEAVRKLVEKEVKRSKDGKKEDWSLIPKALVGTKCDLPFAMDEDAVKVNKFH